jgi:beta-lactamase regulating signal transducer with metallopeptidase domain
MLAMLIDLGWKSALVAGFALLANRWMRARPPGERVAMLRAALAALLMLPLLALAAPALELAVLPAREIAPGISALTGAGTRYTELADSPAGISIDWLSALYLTGAGLLILRLGMGLFVLARWTLAAAPTRDPRWLHALDSARLRRPVRLLVSPHVAAPMSWGLMPAWVLIGPGTERRAEQAESVVAHELAHVRRFDWPVLMLAQLATLLFWFNPLVWLLGRELARQTEMAADGEAIRHVARADYAQALLTLAGHPAHPAACGMSITHTALAHRICCVLDGGTGQPASRAICVALLICGPLAVAPLAAMQLVPAPSPAVASAPRQIEAAASALDRYMPKLVPAARAAEAPVPQPSRSIARRVAPVRVLRRVIPARETSRDLQQASEAMSPPRPPSPPAPGTEAFAWREALGRDRRIQIETRGREMAQRHARMEIHGGNADRGDLAKALTDAAKGLRVKAQELEAVAADGSVAAQIRSAHARAAGSLRNQADRLDKEARRKLGG